MVMVIAPELICCLALLLNDPGMNLTNSSFSHHYQDPWTIFLDAFLHDAIATQSSADLAALALTSRAIAAHLRGSPRFRLLQLLHLRNRMAIVDDRNLRFLVHTEVKTACGITGKGFGVYFFTSDPQRIRTPAPLYLKDLHAEIWRLANLTHATAYESTCAIGRIHNCACDGYYQPRLKVRLSAMTKCKTTLVEKHSAHPHAYVVSATDAPPRWLLSNDMAWDDMLSCHEFGRRVAAKRWWDDRHPDVRRLAPILRDRFMTWRDADCPVVFQTNGCSFNLSPFHAEYTTEIFLAQHAKGQAIDLDDDDDTESDISSDDDGDAPVH
ncbi:hypothetical protein SDRG_08087 [Saprolegnia diclina VS20]|uniref:Uncharacterized protein n=1 Tax=Saprolegnia diclina (strain VS20) TaxID=1156394 RepID=T0Q8T8_SAPDV|nr:hypothetical protein SDRG_08087 [Saprolegnia diclina VS20]EQC34314.1 hypothetical protein SDRG_08087 [Saprolegnia diclina VS20]|eukprot:XP_008612176.1 hypothetical protein SDRG_08087 [Saprolegnia diclina VS20]